MTSERDYPPTLMLFLFFIWSSLACMIYVLSQRASTASRTYHPYSYSKGPSTSKSCNISRKLLVALLAFSNHSSSFGRAESGFGERVFFLVCNILVIYKRVSFFFTKARTWADTNVRRPFYLVSSMTALQPRSGREHFHVVAGFLWEKVPIALQIRQPHGIANMRKWFAFVIFWFSLSYCCTSWWANRAIRHPLYIN